MKFLNNKFSRLRRTDNLRRMFAETKIAVSDFVMPFFAVEGTRVKQPINSMSEIFRYSADLLVEEIKEIYKLGIPSVLLFGVPNKCSPQFIEGVSPANRQRSDAGRPFRVAELDSSVFNQNSIVQKAMRAVKKEVPGIVVITDVCLCSYTYHGHCGIVKRQKTEVGGQKKDKNPSTVN